jgi:predicted RNase H-like HicB family nuclease
VIVANTGLKSQETVVTFVLEPGQFGGIVASVMEFPGCRAEASTKEKAIALVRDQLRIYLAQVEFVRVPLPSSWMAELSNPWEPLFGLFKDDPDFAEIAAEIRAIRDSDDESEVDPALYETR